MPYNILDDRAMASDCLCSQKFLSSSYNHAITETASEDLRRDFLNIFQDEQKNLKLVFDAMYTRGWYQLNMADQQDISQVQQQFQQARAQMAGIGAGQQAQMPGGRPQPYM
ncbi:MAG: hypothetical protein PWP65_1686 [Clostridia bacterium]|nr:hypothetical protein [Clostridia bacterium]